MEISFLFVGCVFHHPHHHHAVVSHAIMFSFSCFFHWEWGPLGFDEWMRDDVI